MSNQTGTLYVVATPIGNLEDIGLRALAVLKQVKYIAAEDTRHSKKLFNHYNLSPVAFPYHKFNEAKSGKKLLKLLETGEDVAIICDAGTPLISDPGSGLVRSCHERGIRVVPVPGPSALASALSVAGLPADRFVFEGFLPEKQAARLRQLARLVHESRTLVFYEAPHRIVECLQDVVDVFGSGRTVVIARELTKKFETVRSAPAGEIADWVRRDKDRQKGEFVVIVGGKSGRERYSGLETDTILHLLLEELPLKKAAGITAKITGESRNEIYQRGLELKESNSPRNGKG